MSIPHPKSRPAYHGCETPLRPREPALMDAVDPPNMGEIVRRLEGIASQLAEITREMKEDRVQAATTYMRQDVYMAQRLSDAAVVADLHGDIAKVDGKVDADRASRDAERKAEAANRRQVLMWLGGLTVTLLLGIGGLLISLLTFLG